MDAAVTLLPLLPLVNALWIAVFIFNHGVLNRFMALWTDRLNFLIHISIFLLAAGLVVADFCQALTGTYALATWLQSDQLNIEIRFISTGFRLQLAALVTFLMMVAAQFSRRQLKPETGYYRFIALFNLFTSATLLFILSANLVLAFIGLELTGLCIYFMVGHAYENTVSTYNATRTFIIARIGDAGFLFGIAITYTWVGSCDWKDLTQLGANLEPNETYLITLYFTLAALTKAAQFPFSPWLTRAMDGPLVASALVNAIYIHFGVFLIIVLQPLFERSALMMHLLAGFGLVSACYCYVIRLTQTDFKSAQSYAATLQVGVMFIECGLGWWQLAALHLYAHALYRSQQMLNMGHYALAAPLAAKLLLKPLRHSPRAYVLSQQNIWLDPLIDWAVVTPILKLSKDLGYFDDHFIDAGFGTPATASNPLSSLAQLEAQKYGMAMEADVGQALRPSGVLGTLAHWLGAGFAWLENLLLGQAVPELLMQGVRQFGRILLKVEALLVRPRYLSLLVFITLLTVL